MSNTYKVTFCLPDTLRLQYLKYFLKEVSNVFSYCDKKQQGVLLDVSRIHKIDMLGLLLIYKFMDYTVRRHCFNHPKTNISENEYLCNELERYGFKTLLTEYYSDARKIPDSYNLKFVSEKNLFIAPMELARNAECRTKEQKNHQSIYKYYKYDTNIISAVLQSIGEIASNFKEHAVQDTKSILIAQGNKEEFELACADNGDGIDRTLAPFFRSCRYSSSDLLKKSVERDVTSKPFTAHTGHGLWLVNQFVTESKGILVIVSNDAYFSNKAGLIKAGSCAIWKGTIVYLRLKLTHPDVFLTVMRCMDTEGITLSEI